MDKAIVRQYRDCHLQSCSTSLGAVDHHPTGFTPVTGRFHEPVYPTGHRHTSVPIRPNAGEPMQAAEQSIASSLVLEQGLLERGVLHEVAASTMHSALADYCTCLSCRTRSQANTGLV